MREINDFSSIPFFFNKINSLTIFTTSPPLGNYYKLFIIYVNFIEMLKMP